ncbi:MAG: phospholipase, partial [Akkermansiaceae bacterium]|nr:phospholipase [Akkermansiaceae bacterium]
MFAAHTFTPGGETLPYRMDCPEEGAEDVSLILFLHGAGERGADNEAQCR